MPGPEASPEFAHETALSLAHGMVHDLVRALSVDPVPSPVHEIVREVEKGVDPLSPALPEAQKAWWVEEVSLWLPAPPESSSLEAISESVSYFTDQSRISTCLFFRFLFSPTTPFGFPGSLVTWALTTSTRPFFMVRAILTRTSLGGTIGLDAFSESYEREAK